MTSPARSALHLSGAAVALALSAAPLAAQTDHGAGHDGMAPHGIEPAYSEPMDVMMRAMDAIEPTGDPDADFLLMMIPHHQSAVDMARALLEQSDDAEVAALAQAVIDTQQAEITAMTAMLARLGQPVE